VSGELERQLDDVRDAQTDREIRRRGRRRRLQGRRR
jgi:hypothetical protein